MRIPKIIHYCWFGGKPLPDSAVKCIESWKKFFPDYEIRQWDETNFDVNIIQYTSDAYKIAKYAFVSDYARMWVLFHYGGIYFDTDVEVIKSYDQILAQGGFMGFETFKYVNPGLGMALPKGSMIAWDVMEEFSRTKFLLEEGNFNPNGIVPITTKVLEKNGLITTRKEQKLGDVKIYPIDWFNPLDPITGRLKKTINTHSIHWYTKSWMEPESEWKKVFSQYLHRILGKSFPSKIKKFLGQ